MNGMLEHSQRSSDTMAWFNVAYNPSMFSSIQTTNNYNKLFSESNIKAWNKTISYISYIIWLFLLRSSLALFSISLFLRLNLCCSLSSALSVFFLCVLLLFFLSLMALSVCWAYFICQTGNIKHENSFVWVSGPMVARSGWRLSL